MPPGKDTEGDESPSNRVRITYQINGEDRELPFVIGVLTALSGELELPLTDLRHRRFVTIDRDSFDRVLKRIAPRLVLTIPGLQGQERVDQSIVLRFSELEDFDPDSLARHIPFTNELLQVRQHLFNLRNSLDPLLEGRLEEACHNRSKLEAIAHEISSSGHSPDDGCIARIAMHGRTGEAEYALRNSKRWIREFFAQVISGEMPLSKDVDSMLAARIARLDRLISEVLNAVMHSPEFMSLEASWRGLEYLVSKTNSSSMCKIKVLNVNKRELLRDLHRAAEFDRTFIFDRVYNEEFDILGGEPFGVLVADFYMGRNDEDIELLEGMSGVAAAAHCPFIAGADPSLFSFVSFEELAGPYDIKRRFDTEHYKRWRAFRESEDSRYVGLALPRILLRPPYGQGSAVANTFEFSESCQPPDLLWGNASYAFGARLAEAFHLYGWCAAIRGVETGGLVSGLPVYSVLTDDGDTSVVCPTEVAITDRRESELSALGLIPLCHRKGTDQAVFFHAQSCNMPRAEESLKNAAIAMYSSQLEYIMATSRFCHYLKAMIRDKVDRFKSATECEEFLNRWISGYVQVDADDSSGQEPAKPLRHGRIEVRAIQGYSGTYQAVALLQPQFQLHQLTVPLRLVMKLQLGGTLIYRVPTPLDE